MRIEITKHARDDAIRMVRGDGSHAFTRVPKKGPVPHDAVHYFVERGLGLSDAFWGKIAAGARPEELAAMAKAAGHASANRAGNPHGSIVELLQAERLVECFEAELWSMAGGTDDAGLIALAGIACAASRVPLPELNPAALAAIRAPLGIFVAVWSAAPRGHVAVFDWD